MLIVIGMVIWNSRVFIGASLPLLIGLAVRNEKQYTVHPIAKTFPVTDDIGDR